MPLNIQIIDALADPRWNDLAAHHPRASVFHQPGWLQALARTYGYPVFALTSAQPGQPLRDGIVFCRVASWITGVRAVSLPFSDHCEPLLDGHSALDPFLQRLAEESDRQHWKYAELRPLQGNSNSIPGFRAGPPYCFHTLDLTRTRQQLFHGFHRDCVQRKIRRAERERISYECGRSEQLLHEFYHLLLLTRQRHHLFPQPRAWFQNLLESMGDAVQIRVARKDGIPIAAILTLRHGASVVYKYGGSNQKFHNLGAIPFLFWNLIEESKDQGVAELDFGRSDMDNQGLITFKDRFGTRKLSLQYQRYSHQREASPVVGWAQKSIAQLFSLLPHKMLPVAGRVLYRHIG